VNDVNSSVPRAAFHWGVLAFWISGLLAHSICIHLLSTQPQSKPGWGAVLLSFLPYLISAASWRISRRIRIVTTILVLPVSLDIGWLAFLCATHIGWEDELVWRSMQLFGCLVILPAAFLVALRGDRRYTDRIHDDGAGGV
jgi:hypothetical protein